MTTRPTPAERLDQAIDAVLAGSPARVAAAVAGVELDRPCARGLRRRPASDARHLARRAPLRGPPRRPPGGRRAARPWILRHPGRLIVTGAVGSAVGVGVTAYAVWREPHGRIGSCIGSGRPAALPIKFPFSRRAAPTRRVDEVPELRCPGLQPPARARPATLPVVRPPLPDVDRRADRHAARPEQLRGARRRHRGGRSARLPRRPSLSGSARGGAGEDRAARRPGVGDRRDRGRPGRDRRSSTSGSWAAAWEASSARSSPAASRRRWPSGSRRSWSAPRAARGCRRERSRSCSCRRRRLRSSGSTSPASRSSPS